MIKCSLSQEELLSEIEKVRSQMNHLSRELQRTSAEMLELSTKLDKLLNAYQFNHMVQK
ncbi:aspartyl-phosphate phosphatase Spo0E family protein [Paenalkalicoccus suaedae]|uniref:Aspartyl-phosphate phosphatase Spo0E family protein n=1 Tax=Paenalkalicoccus suaedae TaxID=2592382 RepID=A0A859F9J5_9BACI|nr:aspartyl-phosphate phosphatase Spo0E family protein [Paenalkalicoccus suaedae]QKS69823.1 aspartyl-phosphate phosphatase Spo0E family protein [Paenalkalicoccus suaedae]